MIQRIEMVLVQSYDLRARCALAAAVEDSRQRPRLLVKAQRDAGLLERVGSPWALGLASLLRAGIASVRGFREAVAAHLGNAEAAFLESDMAIHGAVTRRRRGQCDAVYGAAGVDEADHRLRDQGIRRPERLAAVFSPGCWEV